MHFQLVGIAVGDAAAPLEKATHSESLNFALLHAPTRTLQELFERTLNEGDYTRAKILAQSYDTIDVDLVLKREWRDICHNKTVTVDSVDQILRRIGDDDWVIETCATSDVVSLPVQKALLDLGTSFPNASFKQQIRLHHNARLLNVCGDVTEYIETRGMSCVEAAFRFAERLNFVSLDRLIEQNYSLLVPFVLDILSHIPPSVPPSRFEHLIPTRNGRTIQLEKVLNAHLDALLLLANENEETMEAVRLCNVGTREVYVFQLVPKALSVECSHQTLKLETSVESYADWVTKRTDLMDSEAGLPEHCVSLLEISVQRGYEELIPVLESFKNYNFFVSTCSLVGESFQRFHEAPFSHYISFLRKLPVDEIVRHILEILSLFEWKTRGGPAAVEDFKNAVSSFLLTTCESSVDVLKAVQKRRNELLDKDTVIKCLCNLELTGDSLLRAVLTVGSCPELVSALGLFHSRGVKPTFKQLWDSTTDSVYADVIKPEESMDIVIREMLSDPNIPHERNVLQLFLTLDKNPSKENNHNRLSLEKSAELLIGKSEELMQEASAPSDPILRESRSLAEAAREIAPKMAAQQIKLLDIVNLSCELGSTALPVAIKFAEPYPFLEGIVKLDGNYKQGKKCAKLAVLLGVDTPVATALSLCALSALVAHDERYLGKYIHEVISKGRDLPVLHELCVRIMESPFVPAVGIF
ncbi:unnamed protein product [Nippostrongylus brasiliensis]|uniref:Sec39 domain-containing protein n=1 Tax=Nippostrongylus brasiliensis TaxID=27835 RepID=A0A0N4XGY4_NIPBR|nr:unnamed protein product [Nippostrongylus brasiliensis]